MHENPTIVFPEANTVAIEDRPMPSLRPGHLLIRTHCSLVSTGTELTILKGGHAPDSHWGRYGRFPFVPGYDNVGEVMETGEGVDTSWVGRRVASQTPHAAYVAAPADKVAPVPENVPEDQAAFFTIAVIVMNGIRRAGVAWGETVAVYGLGLLGQMAVRLCHVAGARPVIGFDVASPRIQRLPMNKPGIIGVNPDGEDAGEVVKRLTDGRMADCVIELTGNAASIPSEFAVLRPQGRFVVLSSPSEKTLFDFHDLCNAPSYTIIGAHQGSHPPRETVQTPWTRLRHAALFFRLVGEGDLDLSGLISHRAAYRRAPTLYAALQEDRSTAMGVILDWAAASAPDS